MAATVMHIKKYASILSNLEGNIKKRNHLFC